MIDLTRENPVSIKQVAEMFGVHRRTVEAWFGAGLERVKLGGRVYTTRAALQRFSVSDTTQREETDEGMERFLRSQGHTLESARKLFNGPVPGPGCKNLGLSG